ncbi:hypothetical protein Pcinc_013639 [Petrolisthes cinctipes]|uniref:Uncharacterized protein n=1 Tax=Petrolisthes cinctipes TaxID=88211 RepID=A0AAE1FY78_PETCI|nr:hypothetical protein Pcinc_013639 [Petrolisthes cinctipes]
MAGKDDLYEFNAPKHFIDFTKDDIEIDESFFGSAKAVRPAKGRKSEVAQCGVRQSPRLAAISKALRRSQAARRSSGGSVVGDGQSNSSRRSSPAGGHSQNLSQSRVLTPRPSVPKVMGVHGLSAEDKQQLETITTFKKKMAEN